MNGGSNDWTTRQEVSLKIVAQLKPMSQEQQKAFISKLLEHLDPLYVQALAFAYEMAPAVEDKKEGE